MIIRIQAQVTVVLILFAVWGGIYNEAKFYAKVAKHCLGKKIKFRWWDVFNQFDIQNKVTEEEFIKM